MKKIILTYGFIAGAIVSAMLVISQPLLEQGIITYDSGTIVGYTSMVVALALVFFGIKSYRDHYQNGGITFGQAFKIGILITLLASCIYAVSWEIYYNIGAQDFMEQYMAYHKRKLEASGVLQAQIDKEMKEMEAFSEQYKNPVIRFGVTLIEIFPVGLIITVISSALLRKKERTNQVA